jgi:hypothetical protein
MGRWAAAASPSAQAHHWEAEVAVVINDFEVVTPGGSEQPGAKPSSAGSGTPPDPGEIVKTVHDELRTRREREQRLHAT